MMRKITWKFTICLLIASIVFMPVLAGCDKPENKPEDEPEDEPVTTVGEDEKETVMVTDSLTEEPTEPETTLDDVNEETTENATDEPEITLEPSVGLDFISNGDGTCFVSGIGKCTDSDVVIPSESPEGEKVTSIGFGAFKECEELSSLTIADGVESIDAFAFSDCANLTSVKIPDSVTSIGTSAFSGCRGLTSITVAQGNSVFHSVGNCLIETRSKMLVVGCQNSVIPTDGSVTSIDDGAFSGCTGLSSINIPDSVTKIDINAFSGCTGLSSVTIPNSVTKIGSGAFSGCTGLSNITIPGSVVQIDEGAFSHCTGLVSITVDESNRFYHSANHCLIETRSASLIVGCQNSDIPTDGSVIRIDDYAFSGCTGLSSINIPDSVTKICNNAFSGCTGLVDITIPNSVTDIFTGAFSGCTGLVSINIPDGVTSIGARAFYHCPGLTSITVDEGNSVYHSAQNCLIETNNKMLVAGCQNSEIPTDGSVISIDNYVFYGCTGLVSINIPDSVTSIGIQAFLDCQGLTDVHYSGTQAQWREMNIGRSNDSLTSATIHCADGDITPEQ